MMEIIARSKEHAALKKQADSAASGAGATSRHAADRIDEVIEDETEVGHVGEGGKDSWKSSWDNLMEGLNSPSTDKGSPPYRGTTTVEEVIQMRQTSIWRPLTTAIAWKSLLVTFKLVPMLLVGLRRKH